MGNGIAKILYFIRSNWHNQYGLLAATIFFLILLKFVFGSSLEKVVPSELWYLPYLSLIGVIALCWALSRIWYPRNKKNKVGILIAIHTENERDQSQLKNDFIREMKNLISSRSLNSIFHIMELDNYKSTKVQTKEQAFQVSRKTKSHFLIWGIFKKRQLHGRSACALNLQSLVRHVPISNVATKTQFAKEFTEVFPGRIRFLGKDELMGFELTTSVIHEVAIYLIGRAALISGDLSLSLDLHNYLFERIKAETLADKLTQLKIIKTRLPKLLALEHLLIANFYYTSKQNRDLNKVKEHSQAAIKYNPQAYDAHLLLAICYFFKKKLPLARQEVSKAKRIAPRDGTVLYSEAFLYFYDDDFRKGDITYGKAVNTSIRPDTVLQIESFITDVLEQELDKAYFYYPLGLINYRVKQDYAVATDSFEKFVKLYQDDPALEEQVRKARIWVRELASLITTG